MIMMIMNYVVTDLSYIVSTKVRVLYNGNGKTDKRNVCLMSWFTIWQRLVYEEEEARSAQFQK